jgi:hypothetical protein
MRIRDRAYLLMIWVFAAMAGQAAAQVPTKALQESNLSPSCQTDEEKVAAPSLVCLKLNKQDVVVGSIKPVLMTVTIYSPKENPVTLARVSLVGNEPKEGPVTFEPPEKIDSGPAGVAVKAVYNEFFTLTDAAEPRIYNVSLKFAYENKNVSIPDGLYRLSVGGGDALVLKDIPDIPPVLTGETATLTLEIKNNYRGYPVRLTNIKITSDSDLIRETDVPLSSPLSIKGKEGARPSVTLDVRPMNMKDGVYGLNDPTLKLEFDYVDGEGRELKSLVSDSRLKMPVKPGVPALALGVLLGVLAGAWVKSLLQKGSVTRKQRLAFMAGTAVLGVITALVAYFGQVKISFLTLSGSYDSPKVLFLIGVAATIVGPAFLSDLFKRSDGKEHEGQQGQGA